MPYPRGRSAATGLVLNHKGNLVNITDPVDLQKSRLGAYWLGQTPDLTLSGSLNAWARLRNPPDSGVDVLVNVWTVTNRDNQGFDMEVYLGEPTLPGTPSVSDQVAGHRRTASIRSGGRRACWVRR